MKLLKTKADLQAHVQDLKAKGKTIGFVPTMGALHEGHLSLIRLAHEHADEIIVSIFVNPAQFAPHEDFDNYPRTLDEDCEKLKGENIAMVYAPTADEIYPDGKIKTVKAGQNAQGLESDFRAHFFDGVCTVVSVLFDHVTPDIAVFGEKDFQQLQVIREMVETQKRNINIIGGPIMRDEQGLALSSRNTYLSAEEIKIAQKLNQLLKKAANTQQTNEDLEAAKKEILKAGFTKIDYIEQRWNRLLAAAWLGKTRLIDNVAL